MISINAEDGGSPEHPKVLYTGAAAKFVHSARWPREGSDKFVLIGGEQNFTGRCERNNSEFSRLQRRAACSAGSRTTFEGPLDQVPPAGNGVYADGKPVAGAPRLLGPLVPGAPDVPATAASSRSPSTRTACASCRSARTARSRSRATSSSLGSSSSSPKWAGKGDVLYSIDYQRGIDILRWKRSTTCPARARARRCGGNQRRDAAARADAGQAAQRDALAARLARRLVAGALLPRGRAQRGGL